MRSVVLKELFAGVAVARARGDMGRAVTGIVYDSRDARPGVLFVAMDGTHTDGHLYIPDAIARGARAVLASRPVDGLPPDVTLIQVSQTRELLSPLSAAFFRHPSRSIRVIGVTGTDGKSSTVWFIDQLLSSLGKKSGLLSTVSFKTGGAVVKNPFRQSTPEAPEIHGMLREMVEAGCAYAIVEATSHGLSRRTGRLADVLFDAAVLTNVTHEHLEFHGSFEAYRSDKANLFRGLAASSGKDLACPRFGVVNADDPSAEYFRRCTELPVYSYSTATGAHFSTAPQAHFYGRDGSAAAPGADLVALDMRQDISGTSFTLARGAERGKYASGAEALARLEIPGPFWVENLLAACLTVSRMLDIDPVSLAPHVASVRSVQGRMDFVKKGQPFSVIVDYAHTPGAFERLLPWVREHASGRVTAVFGSAGERDIAKRPLQGKLAAAACDTVILTEEDPRGEDSLLILEQIAAGCTGLSRGKDLLLVPDRTEAIRLALGRAGPGDVVLLLGKGHEASIIGPRGPREWNERSEAERALRDLGYDQ